MGGASTIISKESKMSAMFRTLAAVMVLAASQASAATGDWPQYGFTAKGDRDNTQETILSRKTVPHLVKKWSANIQAAGAVVANGIVYVCSYDGHLYARDAKTGAPVWQAATGGNIYSLPAVVDGLAYIGSGDGRVYAFDAETGAQRWVVSVNGSVGTALAIADGVIYGGTNPGFAIAIDAKTGVIKWSTQFDPHGMVSAPAVAHGIAYFNSESNINALDIRTGALLWRQHLDNEMGHPGVPAIYKDLVITRSDSHLSAYDAKTGQLRWWVPTTGIMGSIALAGGHVFAAESVYLSSYDAMTGNGQYATYVGFDMTETPALANGVIYLGIVPVGREAATISAFDSDTGKLLWQAPTIDGVSAPPTVSNGMLYVSSGGVAVGNGIQFTAYGLP